MNRAAEQVFFLFFAIHLPPAEEGEFLLCIMLKRDETHFGCFTRYRDIRQGHMQAQALPHYPRKLKKT